MSMVAVFEFMCCRKELVFGRFSGDEMYPPHVNKCPHGCAMPLHPNGRPKYYALKFLRFESEEKLTPALRATWRFPDRSGDLWKKRNPEAWASTQRWLRSLA